MKSEPIQMQRDAEFMELALAQSEIAITKGQTPFGAVVVDSDGKLVAEGHNCVRADLDPAAHGEIVAIRNGGCRNSSAAGRGAVRDSAGFCAPDAPHTPSEAP